MRICDDKEPAKQRYECKACGKRFDALTGTSSLDIANSSRFGYYVSILWD